MRGRYCTHCTESCAAYSTAYVIARSSSGHSVPWYGAQGIRSTVRLTGGTLPLLVFFLLLNFFTSPTSNFTYILPLHLFFFSLFLHSPPISPFSKSPFFLSTGGSPSSKSVLLRGPGSPSFQSFFAVLRSFPPGWETRDAAPSKLASASFLKSLHPPSLFRRNPSVSCRSRTESHCSFSQHPPTRTLLSSSISNPPFYFFTVVPFFSSLVTYFA